MTITLHYMGMVCKVRRITLPHFDALHRWNHACMTMKNSLEKENKLQKDNISATLMVVVGRQNGRSNDYCMDIWCFTELPKLLIHLQMALVGWAQPEYRSWNPQTWLGYWALEPSDSWRSGPLKFILMFPLLLWNPGTFLKSIINLFCPVGK